jgi:transposase
MPQSRDQEVSDLAQVPPQRRRFPESFKREAVRLVTHEQYSFQAAAQAVGVSDNSLRKWHKKYAPQPQACGQDATVEQLQAENIRLRKLLTRAVMERDILKKATAYFANQDP